MDIRRIVLTGGSGMVGRNIQEVLRDSEWEILAPSSKVLNLRDYDSVFRYLSEYKPDLIIHAAGRVGGIQANVKEPVGFLIDNIDFGRNLVYAAWSAGIKRVLNIGSSCMYPREALNPLREEMILTGSLEPTNEGYALAKIVVTMLCKYINQQNPYFQYKTFIPCNLYGRYDKFGIENSHLIPAIIEKIDRCLTSRESVVEIWGNGEARREFMYAGDFALAISHAINTFDNLPRIMNIGVGYDLSVNDYYKTIADVLGYKGGFKNNTSKPTGMARKLVCVNRQKKWGWMPSCNLERGVSMTYDYYKKELPR